MRLVDIHALPRAVLRLAAVTQGDSDGVAGSDSQCRISDAAAASIAALEDLLAAGAEHPDAVETKIACRKTATGPASRTVTGASLKQLCQVKFRAAQ